MSWNKHKKGYQAIHAWIKRRKGKANHCEECGLDKTPKGRINFFEWSNISETYKRDLTDWRQLCMSCHRKIDFKEGTRILMSDTRKEGFRTGRIIPYQLGKPAWNRGNRKYVSICLNCGDKAKEEENQSMNQ